MHLPLGIALTEFLSETQIPPLLIITIFFWERTHDFQVNSVPEYLDAMSFPPKFGNMRNVVINQEAQEQLALRKGLSSLVIPNVFDFDNPPDQVDDYSSDVREELGLSKDDFFILQPTRVVPRKGIEQAIKLVSLLKDPRCKLVISHEAGDEGYEYLGMLEQLAKEEGVDMRVVADRVGEVRQRDSEGRKIYTLWDLYLHADFVTYPSCMKVLVTLYLKQSIFENQF